MTSADGASLYELFEAEGVTLSLGVPTVWPGFLAQTDATGAKCSSLRRVLPGRSGAQVSRLLKRLHLHGLIKKVGHTYKYYLTPTGQHVALTALKLRELVVIPSLAGLLPSPS